MLSREHWSVLFDSFREGGYVEAMFDYSVEKPIAIDVVNAAIELLKDDLRLVQRARQTEVALVGEVSSPVLDDEYLIFYSGDTKPSSPPDIDPDPHLEWDDEAEAEAELRRRLASVEYFKVVDINTQDTVMSFDARSKKVEFIKATIGELVAIQSILESVDHYLEPETN